MPFAVMPCLANSEHIDLVSIFTAPLLATYGAIVGRPSSDITEQILTILPRDRAIMRRATDCVTKNTESRLVAMICRQSLSGKSVNAMRLVMPALFTRISIGPT